MSTNTVFQALNVLNTRNQKKGVALKMEGKEMWNIKLEDGKEQEVTDATFARWYRPVDEEVVLPDGTTADTPVADDDSSSDDDETSSVAAANATVSDDATAMSDTHASEKKPRKSRAVRPEGTELHLVGNEMKETRAQQVFLITDEVTLTTKGAVKLVMHLKYREHTIKVTKYGPTIQSVTVMDNEGQITYRSPKASVKDVLIHLGVSEQGQNWFMEDMLRIQREISKKGIKIIKS